MSDTPRMERAANESLVAVYEQGRQLERELAEVTKQRDAFRDELSKVMPPDFKDWWENDKKEWPLIARLTIEGKQRLMDMDQETIEGLHKQLDEVTKQRDALVSAIRVHKAALAFTLGDCDVELYEALGEVQSTESAAGCSLGASPCSAVELSMWSDGEIVRREDHEEMKSLLDDNKFLSELMLIKFSPTNYCLTSTERKKLKACYKRAFSKPNADVMASLPRASAETPTKH